MTERERLARSLKEYIGEQFCPTDSMINIVIAWHSAEVARIVEPLVRYKKRMSYFKIWRTKKDSEIYDMIDIAINLANGGE